MATTPSRSPSLAPRAKRLRRDPVTRVTHGCCVTGMRAMRDGGARLVLADPPYRGDTAEWDSDGAYMEFAAAWMREAARVLQPGGALLFYGSPCTLFTSRMNVLLADELHMHHVQTLTWVYTQGAKPFIITHEHTHALPLQKPPGVLCTGGDSRLETMKSYSVRSELIEWWVKPAGVRTFHPELATERYSEEDKRAALAKGVGRVSEASIDKGRPPREYTHTHTQTPTVIHCTYNACVSAGTWVDIPRENSRSKERQYGKHP